ncbi:hypothetical protein GE454_16200, partial [Pseudomonas soli]|nr:hypothetical protein [Pseudomonas soli]
MAPIQIMSVVGSAVPSSLRQQVLFACWYLLVPAGTCCAPVNPSVARLPVAAAPRPWPAARSTIPWSPVP